MKTVPNQRIVKVQKQPTDKQHLYTTNNLSAIDQASKRLQSFAGFKLYVYLAKNQNNYEFAFSSKDFMEWSGVSKSAYDTAFTELVKEGYLKQTGYNEKKKNSYYLFSDKVEEKSGQG